MGGTLWRVSVRRNLVVRVAPVPGEGGGDDPLEASTKLAQNNQQNGCLDGDYDFATAEHARHFAALCAGYMKSLCEKTIDSVNQHGDLEGQGWTNPFLPGDD